MNNNSIGKAAEKNNPPSISEEAYPFRHIGHCIQTLRLGLGWSVKELADKVPCGNSTLNEWELGKTIPQHSNLIALAKALDTSPANITVGMTFLEDLKPVTEENQEELKLAENTLSEIAATHEYPEWHAPESEQEVEESLGSSFTGSKNASFGTSRVTGKGVVALKIIKKAQVIHLDDNEIAELLLSLGIDSSEIHSALRGWA
ncbi:helix-turn-helix domain-containing protein [Endozoicomonas arenosclerae]|uniref:helix-turn-helix domain-containing protein n=1 Tax=Endozoicomonas arenosclerae TaxID=1633495 RepID=UPI000785CD2F|nr:helix-turn-helix domain-containing protein [Endozoicomonas arenosclerae]